ncbi:hypothetical protein ES705_33738 [subsurface metagenome]
MSEINNPGPWIPLIIAHKAADQAVNNSVVLVNDDHLLFTLVPNAVYLVELYFLQQSVSVNSNFKSGWSYPAGCSIQWGIMKDPSTAGYAQAWRGVAVTKNAARATTESESDNCAAFIGTQALRIIALVINGANAGNLNFQWAQDTAVAEDTKVLENSCLIAHRLK